MISAAQLSRWRKRGLLGPTRRPGRGRGPGRRLLYRFGAHRLAVYLTRGVKDERSLERVGWQAWLAGYPVTQFARGVLERTIQGFELYARSTASSGSRAARRKQPRSENTKAELAAPLMRSFLLGLAPTFDQFVKYQQSLDRVLPTAADKYLPIIRQIQQSGQVVNVRAMRRAIREMRDADLEGVRDCALIASGVFQQLLVAQNVDQESAARVGKIVTDPRMVLTVVAIAAMRVDDSPPLYQVLGPETRAAFARAARSMGQSPQQDAVLRVFREVRKELRRARRKNGLL